VVEGTALEKLHGSKAHRGFESLLFRQESDSLPSSAREVGGLLVNAVWGSNGLKRGKYFAAAKYAAERLPSCLEWRVGTTLDNECSSRSTRRKSLLCKIFINLRAMSDVKFKITFLNLGEKIPPPQEVSAVFLVALQDGKIVAIHNHRGWDLPAGHLEDGEGILEALKREAQEEASMVFTNPIPFALVTSDSQDSKYVGKCMVGFTTKEFVLNDFIPAPDSDSRKIILIEDFLSLYEQDREAMRLMVEKAQGILGGQ
jgi:8-oxo-dGTP diphosphatase